MKIVGISDIHGNLPVLPDGDILCITGDIFPLEYQRNLIKSISWFCLEFVPWTDNLNFEKIIFIAGNHDFAIQQISNKVFNDSNLILENILPGNNINKHKLVYLQDSLYFYKNITFYGTPWCPDLSNWAFYKSSEGLFEKFKNIPQKVDVLLTHCPPRFSDVGMVLQNGYNFMKNYGCQELAEEVAVRQIKWHLCGHVHSGNHNIVKINDYTNVVNVSLKDENYKLTYEPFVFEI